SAADGATSCDRREQPSRRRRDRPREAAARSRRRRWTGRAERRGDRDAAGGRQVILGRPTNLWLGFTTSVLALVQILLVNLAKLDPVFTATMLGAVGIVV